MNINDPATLVWVMSALAGTLASIIIWVVNRVIGVVDRTEKTVNILVTDVAVIKSYFDNDRPHNQRKKD